MRLFAVFLVAGVAATGTVHASSIVVVEGGATNPSSVEVALPSTAVSVIEIGVPAIDTGKVAALNARSGRALAPELMIIRGGEVGSESPEPTAAASAVPEASTSQQADAGGEPEPAPVAME